jgi:thiamine pyrophosphokinase
VRIGLVLGGVAPTASDMKLLDTCESVVASDGGAHELLKAERPPSVIVGDLDSLTPDDFKWADALDIPIERHPAGKDETDGELALQKCFDMGATSVLILGAHGGRTSMFLGNIKLLRVCHERGVDAVMIGSGESIRFLSPGGEYNLAGRTQSILNILAMDTDAVVSIAGTKWEAVEAKIGRLAGRGLSNTILKDGAKVRCHEGTILVIVEQSPEK